MKALNTALLCLLLLLVGRATPIEAQVRRVYDRGAAGVLQLMERLRTTASVLVIGAHPDDEDSAFIARAARGDHARVAYLSLNRGEGGQNVIGAEQYDTLGVIRTEELLQARALDGGEQFFGSMYDFGFSKTLEESSRLWGDREVTRDIVRIIRKFRPLVVYSVYSGTPADGHGHHQLAGKLAPVAYRAAGDPSQFSELSAEGLAPWRSLKLYRGAIPGDERVMSVETGQLDPVLGRTYAQIAAEGRSQHKSQGQGTPEVNGSVESALTLLDSRVKTAPAEKSVFDGIDTSIPGIAALAGLPSDALRAELDAIDRTAAKAIDNFNAMRPADSAQALADTLGAIRAARTALKGLGTDSGGASSEADFLLARKEDDAARALVLASGAVLDAASEVETVVPGESFRATLTAFLSQPRLVKITSLKLNAPGGWRVEPAGGTADRQGIFTVSVPPDAKPTQPYWLTVARNGQLYTWPAGSPKGEPFDPPFLVAEAQAEISGARVTLTQPLEYRFVDQARGELHRDVDVVPAVSVSFDSLLEIVPLIARGQPRRFVVRLQDNARAAISGDVRIEAPSGWQVEPARRPFSLQKTGERMAISFTVTPAADVPAGQYFVKAVAMSTGREFSQAMQTISYPHIQTHRYYIPARARVQLVEVKVAPVNLGYIMGSGDLVPDALRRLGLPVTLLDEEDLSSGDLSRFDTIVVGIRASEVRPDFDAARERLLDYVRAGGTLIVQYQRDVYTTLNLAPFPASMASRVTDETAPVTILVPDHPAFTTPNRIRRQDFDGWVQDRVLYAFTSFDSRYTALLECHDPGEPPQEGGELYARIGRGNYLYTSYAWFRQLPAGVPGAYRLFANLVSLGADHR